MDLTSLTSVCSGSLPSWEMKTKEEDMIRRDQRPRSSSPVGPAPSWATNGSSHIGGRSSKSAGRDAGCNLGG